MNTVLPKVVVGTSALAVWAAFAAATAAFADPSAAGGHVTIGIVPPQAQMGDGANSADIGEPVRQSLARSLGGSSIAVVPLQSRDASQIDAEAKQQHCDYILYSRVEQKHGGGMGGFLHQLAPLTKALPMLGGLGHGGSGMAGALSAATQTAASASAAASQQEAMQQMAGAQSSSVKAGDTVTFEYRLTAASSTDVIKSDKVVVKAKSNGEDVLNPAIEQVANAIATATGRASGTAAPATQAANQLPAAGGRRSPGGATMDCDHLSAAASAYMNAETCRKLMGAKQAYDKAAADPSASRPGDEQMTCEQIAAELQQQSYTAPDKAKVAQAQTTLTEEQTALAQQRGQIVKTAAVQQAAVDAALATDRATEMATGGAVRPSQGSALEQNFIKQNQATRDRMTEERRPTDQKLIGSTADLGADAAQQLAANPRLARLMQLSSAKRCKGT